MMSKPITDQDIQEILKFGHRIITYGDFSVDERRRLRKAGAIVYRQSYADITPAYANHLIIDIVLTKSDPPSPTNSGNIFIPITATVLCTEHVNNTQWYINSGAHEVYHKQKNGKWKRIGERVEYTHHLDKLHTESIDKELASVWSNLVGCKDQYNIFVCKPDDQLNRENFTKLVDIVRSLVESDDIRYLFLCNINETAQPLSLVKVQRIVDMLPEYKHKFLYVSANTKIEEIYTSICVISNIKTRMKCIAAHFFYHPSLLLGNVNVKDIEYNFKQPRPKKFLFYSRRPRPHRSDIVAHLVKENLLNRGYISYDMEEYMDYCCVHGDLPHEKESYPYIKKIEKDLPFVLNITEERDNPITVDNEDLHHFRDTYFSIVAETSFYSLPETQYDHGVFLSEKIFKPLLAKHPFIVAGDCGTLEELHKIGYKTFHPLINEDYDKETNHDVRMEMIKKEITRLCSLSDRTWLIMLASLKRIILHNHALYVNNWQAHAYIDTFESFWENEHRQRR